MPTAPSAPDISKEKVLELIGPYLKDLPIEKYPLVAFGIRGARLDMGVKGKNDRGIWDDSNGWLLRIAPGTFAIFTANCDPTVTYRKGVGAVASGQIIWFKIGLHKGRAAFRQASVFMVLRDGIGLVKAGIERAFNWHDSISPNNTTSSLGCQTNPKDVFKAVRELGYYLVRKFYPKTETFPFILVDYK